MGMSLAAVAVLPNVGAASEQDTDPFDPDDTEEVDEYIDYYHSLSSSKKQQKAWEKLTDAQQRAFLERYIERIETTTEELADGEAKSTGHDSAEGASQEDVVPAGVETARQAGAVTAYWEGNKMYTWEAELKWSFVRSQNIASYQQAWWRQDHNPDQNIEFAGHESKTVKEASDDSFVDLTQKGRFNNTDLPLSYVAKVKVRGRGDGTGEVVERNDGFPY